MATAPSVYVPLDVNYLRDPKVRRAGSDAEVLFVRSHAHAKGGETDGMIHDFDLEVVAIGLKNVQRRVDALVREGLWIEVDGGWRIAGWFNWNEPTAKLRERKKSRIAGASKTNHRKHIEAGEAYRPNCLVCTGEVEP